MEINKEIINEVCVFIPKTNLVLVKTNIEDLADVMRYLMKKDKASRKLRCKSEVTEVDLSKIKKHFKNIKKEFNEKHLYAGRISGYYILFWK